MARSADLAFRVIALQQRAVTKKRLAEALDQAERDGVPVDRILVKAGDLEAAKAAEICRVRSRYGRRCEDCSS